ncbi:proline dehydrogenase family protein [candidate division KSB1 bacterium]|nr:proline dehydrogenase family protein [candidate division KSB1 bacterium]
MSIFDKLVVATLPLVPKIIVGKVASQYIAGETLTDAVRTVQALNRKRLLATVDVLGEFVHERAVAERDAEEYIDLLSAIHREQLDANVSVKLTAVGASIDPQFMRANLRRVVEAASQLGTFLRIDMEDSPYTTGTLAAYDELRREFKVGVVIQAYLRRSLDDINRLLDGGPANFRLCKGIYVEPEAIAYQGKQEIRDNYVALLDRMFERGAYVGIATHDDWLIAASERLIRQHKLTPNRYEFQMLLGVLPRMRDELQARGHRVRIYVPYGKSWYGYSTRRLKENPRLAGQVLRGIFKK